MSIQKKPYEISVWEDVIVYVGISGTEYSSIAEMSEAVKYQYYTERELAIIGSSTMTSPARTVNNIFKRNVNGVETLTFDMYYQYEDVSEGKIIHNPLIDLVIDERKVKLHYEDKWHDFIVKKDDEKGRDYKYSFTCTGLAANELGKTGFNIELDTELKNNTGTVQELGAAVLEGSDWQLAENGQEVIQQTNDEALYLIQLNSQITGTVVSSDTTKTINSGSWIYVYYTSYINQVENYFQFIYVDKSNGLGTPYLYEDKITIYCNNTSGGTYDLYINNVSWVDGKPSFEQSSTKTVADYRGRRYVRKQLMDYDPVLEQTVYKYKGNLDNKDYYGYTTTEFLDATSVTNFIYNSTNFSGTSYWTGHNNTSIDARVYPDVNPQNANTTEFNQYLIVNLNFKLVEITETQFNNNKTGYWRKQGDNYVQCTNNEDYSSNISYYIQGRVINDGILQNYSRINSFEKGEYYRFKIWVGEKDDNSGNIVAGSIPFKCIVKKYVTIDEDTNNDVIYFTFNAAGTQVSNTGYYYVDAQCANSATWEDLSFNVGIFLYPRTNSNINIDYYIKDIQLYRRISNNNGGYLDIGDVPEVRVITHYHFYDPSINLGKISAEDYVFADNNKDNYTPQYGSGENEFEKVRSITAKESNRFNLLQELSETFECWVRFEIEHETNGQIKVVEYDYYESQPNLTQQQFNANKTNYYLYSQYDKVYVQCTNADTFDSKKIYYTKSERKRQSKNVVFYGEILQDNYVGFKYGINLKDNNRTLDSEQIVTKIIVKDNTCEAAENGFCSIARAQDNPIKENFALNLDYYVTQGLINSSNLNNDLYLELNKSIGLYPKLSRYNKERNSLIETQALEANSINRLTSDYQAAQLTYNEAAKALSKLLDPVSGTIVQYTGYQYEDFTNQYTRTTNHSNVPAYKNEVYFIKGAINSISPTPSIFCIKNTDATPVSGTTYYTLENNHFKVFSGTKFSSTQTYYKGVSAQYTAGTYFQTSNSTTILSFSGNNSSEVYIYAAARRVMVVDTQDCINDNYMISKMAEVVTLQSQKDTAEVNMNKAKTDLDNVQADYDTIKAKLIDIAKATEEIEKDFNTKYSRYIQEGSWTDDNYMDDDLYYFDALDVLYQSAYPKVSYNFKVLELSQLEGYEAFKFDIGHKTFVEDTEFFGYWLVNGLKTPVKETVVVTEATLNLDEPDKNDLKVQNYKSHFEDLFQRITAATQSLEYHSGEYGRAAAAMTTEGTVSETVLQKSFATAAYIIQNSRDQSVVWDDTGIQATNLNDPAQVTRLASGGLLVSSDGGQTWGVAISGYGINANYLNVGTIDADKINIMSGAYPTFKWDALGLRAYAFETDNNVIRSYDPTRYVAHDRFGIYGLNGYLTPPELNNVSQVEKNANFALTWNGLFIKTSHRDGYVRISPTEDITLHSTLNNTDVIRGKFGLLGENSSGEEIYGLALYGPELDENNKPIPTVETKSDGTLWLKSQMDIGTSGQGNTIYIGVGEEDTLNPNRYKVIKVNDLQNNEKFIVYSDGTLKASGAIIEGSGTFTGTINANGGHIGNMTIAGLVDTVGIRISPSTGTFKVNGSTATPSSITFEVKSGLEGVTSYTWNYGPNPNSWTGTYVGSSFVLNYNSSLFNSGITYVQASTIVNGTTYSDRVTISEVEDGENGKDANQYTIRTVAEEILKFPNQNEWEDKKYLFSISNFQMLGFDSKNQVPIGNAEYTLVSNLTAEEFNSNKTYYYTKNQSGEFVQCTNSDTFNSSTNYYYKSLLYCVLDIEIEGYKFKELFKPDNGNNLIYSRYVYTQGSDSSNYYFSIINFYNDLLDNILGSNFSDKKYQSVIITATDFNGHQTDYYTYDETQEVYIQCQPNETFDSTKTYYVDYSNEIISTFLDCFENINGFDFRIYGQVIDLDGNTSNIEKFIGVKNGLNSEMLDFSVTAGGVYAAIQGKKLTFDGEGLTVLNNGFKIEVGEENQDKTTIFSVDPLSQQLIMNGSGTFTGTINADSGSFKGSIDAASGAIGGFLINNNSIVSKTQKIQLYSQIDLDLGVIEQGTISSSTYGNSNNSSRVRTQGYVSVLPGHSYIFTVDDNYEIIDIDETTFNSHKDYYYTFNDEQNIYKQCNGSSVFDSSITYYIARQLLIRGYSGTSPETHVSQAYVGFTNFPFTYEVPENTNYIRLVIKKSNNSNITPNEIQNLWGYEDISLINADNIHIGDGGVVDGYLRIGNLSLMNPSKTDKNIIMNLQVPGEDSYFKLTNEGYIEGQNWSIKKETGNPYVVARFGKLVAEDGQFSGVIYATDGSFSGAITASTINATTLNTVNFVTENTRSMGGSFIFKPTFQIVDFEDKSNNTLEFELENTGDYFNFDTFETENGEEISGKSISYNHDNNLRDIESFELELEPGQNLNGYSSPWAAGAGKSKVPVSMTSNNYTNYGINVTVNDDGTITTTGSNTGTGTLSISNNPIFTDSNIADKLVDGQTYFLSGCPAGGSSSTYRLTLRTITNETYTYVSDTGSGISFTYDAALAYCVYININKNVDVDGFVWKPMICLDSETDKTWVPYSNVCPITGYTNATVYDDSKYNGTIDWNQQIKDDYVVNIVTGNPVNINDALEEPIEDLTANISPIQSFNGYDRPWAAGAGVNKAYWPTLSKTSQNGIDYTVTDDGNTLTFYGTATSASGGAYSSSVTYADMPFGPFPAGKYTIRATGFVGQNVNDRIAINAKYSDGSSLSIVNTRISGPSATIPDGTGRALTFEATDEFKFSYYIYIASGTHIDCSVKVQFVEGETLGEWTPYANVCPITGWTGARIYKSGKNLYCADDRASESRGVTFTYYDDGSVQVDGTATGGDALNGTVWSNKTDKVKKRYPVLPAGDYIISDGVGDSAFAHLWCQFFKADRSASQSVTINGESKTSVSVYNDTLISSSVPFIAQIRIIVNSGKTADNEILYPMIRSTSTSADFEPPATKYTVDWTSTAGTVYAGTCDAVSGKLKARPQYASYNGETLVGPWLSSMDVYEEGVTPTTGAQVVDLGGTETEYALTPQTVTALVGKNTVWANSGSVTVSYKGTAQHLILNSNEKYFTQINSVESIVNGAGTEIISQVARDNVCNLTQMFGSTTADYVYNLEQAEAGAGVAWFRNLFTKTHYSYNSSEETCVSAVNGDPYWKKYLDWTFDAGEVYGGTIDLMTNLLTVTNKLIVFDGVTYGKKMYYTGNLASYNSYYSFFDDGKIYGNDVWVNKEDAEHDYARCSVLPYRDDTAKTNYSFRNNASGQFQIRLNFLMDEGISTLDTANQWLNDLYTAGTPCTVCYPLEKPLTYQLTQQQIAMLTGQNNIWTDTGTIQLVYNNKQVIVALSGTDSSTLSSNVRFGKVSSISPIENTNRGKVQVKFTAEDYQILNNLNLLDSYQTLTLFGKSYEDLIIGINSDSNSAGNILPPRSLVMRSFTNSINKYKNNIINYNTKLLLGDLSSLVDQDSSYQYLSGYGLYADNVFLHGSLMTRNGDGLFAGINTSKAYNFDYVRWGGNNENIYPDEKIIFWGGANDLSDGSVQSSPFIVTDKGSIFANRGEFKGTVITNSTIANSIIKTPTIYGIGNGPSLKIYNTYSESGVGGIGFYKTTNDAIGDLDDKQTLNISDLGFTHYIDRNVDDKAFKFIEFTDGSNGVRFYGYSLAAYDTSFDGTVNINSSTVYRNKNIENGTAKIEIDENTNIKLNYKDKYNVTINNEGIFNTGGDEGTTIFQGVGANSSKQIKYTINNNGYYCMYVMR